MEPSLAFVDDEDLNGGEYPEAVSLDDDDGGREIGENKTPVYCVPVLLRRRTLRCLVLVQTGKARGEYRRVGVYATGYEADLSIMGRREKPYWVDPGVVHEDGRITII